MNFKPPTYSAARWADQIPSKSTSITVQNRFQNLLAFNQTSKGTALKSSFLQPSFDFYYNDQHKAQTSLTRNSQLQSITTQQQPINMRPSNTSTQSLTNNQTRPTNVQIKQSQKQLRKQQAVKKLKIYFEQNSLNELEKKVYSIFNQLQLNYNPANLDDNIQIAFILFILLKYPREDFAERHRNANRLGTLDLSQQAKNTISNIKQENPQPIIKNCICCDLKQQPQQIKTMTNLRDVKNIGISTHLYFLTVENLLILLTILFAIFSCFAIVTNIISSNIYKQSFNGKEPQPIINSFSGLLVTSIGSNQFSGANNFNTTALTVQAWLGCLCILVWMIALVFIKTKQKIKQSEIDYEEITIADYTLLFEKMPMNTSKTILQKQLQQYVAIVKGQKPDIFQKLQQQIQIQKTNPTSPFYLQEDIFDTQDIKQINKLYNKKKQQFRQLIIQRQNKNEFLKAENQRNLLGKQLYLTQKKRFQIYKKTKDNFVQKKKAQIQSQKQFIDYFVTFKSTKNKQLIQKLHQKQKFLLANAPCCKKRIYYGFKYNQQIRQPIIRPAPQPEDINWMSLSRKRSQIIALNILSFGVTLIILCLSFFVILALSKVQIYVNLSKPNDDAGFLHYLAFKGISIGISIIIVIFNIVISAILNYLTKMQRNQSYTHEQSSIAVKTVIATLFNIILIPLAVNFYIKGNIYGVDGLSEDVFNLAVSNAIVSSVTNFINPGYRINRIKYWWYNKPYRKLWLNQQQLNILNENVTFQVGTSYASIITLYLFTCFFASLQPLIILISIIGLFLTFFVSKYNLYKRCKRPKPGNNTINYRMYLMISLGPLFFTIGNYLWINLSGKLMHNIPITISFILSIAILFNPYDAAIVQTTRGETKLRQSVYAVDRHKFLTQYSKLNPLTAKQEKDKLKEQNKKQQIEQQNNNNNKNIKRNKQQSIAGFSVNNNQDKLKMAQLFQDIDDLMQQQDKYENQMQKLYYPVQINHKFQIVPTHSTKNQESNINNNQVKLQNISNQYNTPQLKTGQFLTYGVYAVQHYQQPSNIN